MKHQRRLKAKAEGGGTALKRKGAGQDPRRPKVSLANEAINGYKTSRNRKMAQNISDHI